MGGAASGCLLHYRCSVLPARLLVVDQAQRQRSLSRLTGIQPCYSAAGGLAFKYHPHRSCPDGLRSRPSCLPEALHAREPSSLSRPPYSTVLKPAPTRSSRPRNSRPRNSPCHWHSHSHPTATVAHPDPLLLCRPPECPRLMTRTCSTPARVTAPSAGRGY